MSRQAPGLQGGRLRALREQHELTQEQLAALLGKDKRQILRYEADEVDPGSAIVAALAYHLETTSDYLLGLIDDPTPRLYEAELSDDERALIVALRQRRTNEAVQRFAALSKPDQ